MGADDEKLLFLMVPLVTVGVPVYTMVTVKTCVWKRVLPSVFLFFFFRALIYDVTLGLQIVARVWNTGPYPWRHLVFQNGGRLFRISRPKPRSFTHCWVDLNYYIRRY